MILVAYGADRTAEHTRKELAIHSFGGPPKGWRVDLDDISNKETLLDKRVCLPVCLSACQSPCVQ